MYAHSGGRNGTRPAGRDSLDGIDELPPASRDQGPGGGFRAPIQYRRLLATALRFLDSGREAREAVVAAVVAALEDQRPGPPAFEMAAKAHLMARVVKSLERMDPGSIDWQESLPRFTPDGAHERPPRLQSVRENMASGEIRGLVRRYVAELPPEFRAAYILADVEGHTIPETAALLLISPQTARARLRLARQFLRARLFEDGPPRPDA